MVPGHEIHFDSFSAYFSHLWLKIHNRVTFIEIGVLLGIIFASYLFQRWLKHYYNVNTNIEKKTGVLSFIISMIISFAAPMLAFFCISIAMSISSKFTHNLEVYHFGFHATIVWFLWILAIHVIPDAFVRSVLCCTLIPFLILWTLGVSDPVIDYLNALSLNLGVMQLSIFLILKILLIATCLLWFARIVTDSVHSFLDNNKKITPEVRDLMQNLFRIIFYTVVALVSLDLVGVDLKSLTLLGGAVGIGIGLGLQKIAANFISSVIILFEQKIKVGHFIEIYGSGNPGWIRHLGARAAIIDMGDGKELLVPNEELLTKTVIDWTARDSKARSDLRIKVSFQSNLERAKQIIIEAAQSHPYCSKSFAPSTYLEKFTDNGAQFLLQFWVDNLAVGKMDMQNDVLLTIWKKFSEEGIEHPIISAHN